jgi:hypothetical protein
MSAAPRVSRHFDSIHWSMRYRQDERPYSQKRDRGWRRQRRARGGAWAVVAVIALFGAWDLTSRLDEVPYNPAALSRPATD